MINLKRIAQHLFMTHWKVNNIFTKDSLREIEHLIRAGESTHNGEIRFVVEGALDYEPLLLEQEPKERAVEIFSQLRIWDTEHNNGLLIYLLLADHAVEIIADRGIHEKVGTEQWQKICRSMEDAFKKENYTNGVIMGINAMTQLLAKYFPAASMKNRTNELPDAPVLI